MDSGVYQAIATQIAGTNNVNVVLTNTPVPWWPSASCTSTLTPNGTNIINSCTPTLTPKGAAGYLTGPVAQGTPGTSGAGWYVRKEPTQVAGDAQIGAIAIWTAQPSGKPEFIPINPTNTLTPTWVPSMTPSQTKTPEPLNIQNYQKYAPVTLTFSDWGDGANNKAGAAVTLPFVPKSLSAAPLYYHPAGMSGSMTIFVAYTLPGGMGQGYSTALTNAGTCPYIETNATVFRLWIQNATPTPNVTPAAYNVLLQPYF